MIILFFEITGNKEKFKAISLKGGTQNLFLQLAVYPQLQAFGKYFYYDFLLYLLKDRVFLQFLYLIVFQQEDLKYLSLYH